MNFVEARTTTTPKRVRWKHNNKSSNGGGGLKDGLVGNVN